MGPNSGIVTDVTSADLQQPRNPSEPRFLTLSDVAEILATSTAQVRALVASHELRAIQIGGRGQWRVETVELEAYIQRMYAAFDAKQTAHESPVSEA